MRRVWLSCLAAAVLLATTAGGALTQDEDLRMGDDPAYFERVEVPEVGLAMAFPSEWLIEIEMDYAEIEEGDPETGYWTAIYAHDDGVTWCDLTMYVSQMSDLDGLVPYTAERFAESGSDDVAVQWQAVSLPLGEAYRIDVQDPGRGEYSSFYLFDADSARYYLSCMSDERDARDWMDIAETIEWLTDTEDVEPGVVEPEVIEPDEPRPEVVFAAPPYELQWRQFGAADLTILLPADWQVDVPLEVGESMLPDAYAEAGPATHVDVLSAESGMGDWCLLRRFEGHPMPFDEHAAWDEATWAAVVSEDMSIERQAADLGGRPGWRIDLSRAGEPGGASIFLIDDGARRYELQCGSSLALNPSWEAMAASVTPLGVERGSEPSAAPQPSDAPEPTETLEPSDPSEPSLWDRWVEIPEAGVALTIPAFWTYRLDMEPADYTLPSDVDEGAPVRRTSILTAFPMGEGMCFVESYEDMPMSAERHASEHGWAARSSLSEELPETTRVRLPAGEAYRVVYESLFGASLAYVFDVDGTRYVVDCLVGSDGGAGARAIAASVTPLDADLPPLGLQRVEFADADVAVTLPSDWEVLPVMEFVDAINPSGDPDAPESDLWRVMQAYPVEDEWCDIYMLGGIPLSLEDHGDVFAEIAATSYDPPRDVEVEPVSLPIGDAVRVIETSEEGVVKTIYLFDVSGNREYLVCNTAEQPDDDWLAVAESLESLSAGPGDTRPDVVDDPAVLGLERVDVPEAGVSMLLPPEWDVEVTMKGLGYGLPPEYEDVGVIEAVKVLEADSGMGDDCTLNRHADNPMSLQEQAMWEVQNYRELGADDPPTHVERRAWVVAGEAAERIDFTRTDGPERMSIFLFDSGGVRYGLQCHSDVAENPMWQQIADSVQPLDGDPVIEPEPDVEDQRDFGADLERFELADAGVAISLSPAWEVDTEQEQLRATLPPEYGETATVPLTQYLAAFEHDEGWWCAVYRFDEIPLSVDEQAAWQESLAASDPDDPATVEITPVTLPVGDAVRVFKDYEDSADSVAYLFDLDGYRYDVGCGGETVPDDAWLSVVQTVERLGGEPTDDRPPGVPAEAAAWYEAGPFESLIPVDETRVMRAWCERALWIEFSDETFAERVECTLSDEPVDPSESQGEVPAETVTVEGGACEWVSDFWVATDGSDVWADSWSITIEPDGSVTGTSVYGAELLECPE